MRIVTRIATRMTIESAKGREQLIHAKMRWVNVLFWGVRVDSNKRGCFKGRSEDESDY